MFIENKPPHFTTFVARSRKQSPPFHDTKTFATQTRNKLVHLRSVCNIRAKFERGFCHGSLRHWILQKMTEIVAIVAAGYTKFAISGTRYIKGNPM